jgi:hypothetical protein
MPGPAGGGSAIWGRVSLGRKGRRRRSCSYSCEWRFENRKKKNACFTKPFSFSSRKQNVALLIFDSSLGGVGGRWTIL